MYIKTNLMLLAAYDLRYCLNLTWFINHKIKMYIQANRSEGAKSVFKSGIHAPPPTPQPRSRLDPFGNLYIGLKSLKANEILKSSGFINYAKYMT